MTTIRNNNKMIHKVLLFISLCCFCLVISQHLEEPLPYNFGYAFQDDHGAAQFRKERGDGHGQVQGSYGFTDERGVQREVHYVADQNGFRAQVKSNEPGLSGNEPADVKLHYSGHSNYHQGFHHLHG